MTRVLCNMDDLDDPGSAGFAVDLGGERTAILVVRRGKEVFGYVNACPHVGAPLDWRPGRFLDVEGRHILCANHGALFTIDDGRCVAGPCAGKALRPCRLAVTDGRVVLLAGA